MNLPDFLHRDADGIIRIRGHRLRLIDVAASYEDGLSPEGIREYYDALTLPLVHKVIAFYLENESEVRELLAADDRSMKDLQSGTRKGPTITELRRRIKAGHPTAAG
jgi:uncharacterized protein (DUF433 family)